MKNYILWMFLQNLHAAFMSIQICFIGIHLYNIYQDGIGQYTVIAITIASVAFLVSLSCWIGATSRLCEKEE